MASRQERDLQQLKNLLKAAQVHVDIEKCVLEALHAESVTDFFGLVKVDNYEDELITLIHSQVDSQKNVQIQKSRLRAAWRAARTAVDQAEKRRGSGMVDDLDDPLDEVQHSELMRTWNDYHHFNCCMYTHPSDILIGRLFRENQRVQATVLSIRKVQSLAQAALPQAREEHNLGGTFRVSVTPEPAPIESVYKYYMGLRILANGYAIAGQHRVPSRVHHGTEVVFSPWDANVNYADECLRKMYAVPMAPHLLLLWLTAKDELTRTKMVELMRNGWPQGEALVKAMAETEIAWTIPPELPGSNIAESSGKGMSPLVPRNILGKT